MLTPKGNPVKLRTLTDHLQELKRLQENESLLTPDEEPYDAYQCFKTNYNKYLSVLQNWETLYQPISLSFPLVFPHSEARRRRFFLVVFLCKILSSPLVFPHFATGGGTQGYGLINLNTNLKIIANRFSRYSLHKIQNADPSLCFPLQVMVFSGWSIRFVLRTKYALNSRLHSNILDNVMMPRRIIQLLIMHTIFDRVHQGFKK